MTEPLIIKDLNCSTCTNDKCYHHPQHFRKVCLWSEADHKKVWEFTKGYGAICHPLALQVLAAPVIAELENYIKCNNRFKIEPYYAGVNAISEHVIELLKGGV